MKQTVITRILPAVFAAVVCILLFLPWGSIWLGGEFKVGDGYTNPIVVEGSYPHGFARAVKTFSEDLNGFQEQCELLSLILMSLCVFLSVLEVFYAVCSLLDNQMKKAMGLTAEISVLVVVAIFLIFAIIYKNGTISFGEYFRIHTKISLNPALFFIVLLEAAGKHILPAIAKRQRMWYNSGKAESGSAAQGGTYEESH